MGAPGGLPPYSAPSDSPALGAMNSPRPSSPTSPFRVLVLACGLLLGGNLLAWSIQTGGGRVDVRDIRFEGMDGTMMSALLYVPPGVDATTKAPGILAIHGYINSRETQDGFAIELARRGFVVLALDQTGHGYSDPPAFANGFGGPDGLHYLRSLDFVDTENIGLEGHSMGGWAVLIAAATAPDDYRSIVIEGSSTGSSGAPDATSDYPRNLAVVFSKYDEFSGMMWGAPIAADVPAGEKLMAAFGTTTPVEPGRVYGSIEEGTARVFHQPPVTHPADHFSRTAIGHAIDWFQTTLDGERPLDPANQVWYWKEFGNLIALAGMITLIFAVGSMLLDTPVFEPLSGPTPPARGLRGGAWWVGAALFAVVPALTLFPFKDFGGVLPVNAFFPQGITNQVVAWAVLNGLISMVLLCVWYFTSGRRSGVNGADLGLTRGAGVQLGRVALSFALAVVIIGVAHASLALSAAVFTVDFRFWVFAVKPMNGLQLRMAAGYLLPFLVFFTIYGTVLFGQLRKDGRVGRGMIRAALLSTIGFAGLIAWQYIPLFAGGTLADPGESLWSIIAFQFVPLMAIVGALTAYFHRRTGQVYLGAFISAMLVTWIVVASQATHHAF